MKTKAMAVLLILSLGFNIGVIFTFGHHWFERGEFGRWHHKGSFGENKFHKMLNLTEEQKKLMENDREEMQKVLAPIRKDLENKRAELFALLDSDNVDNSKVDKLINDISLCQMMIEKTVVEHSVNIRKSLTPAQQKEFKAFLKKSFQKMPPGRGFMESERPMPKEPGQPNEPK
jgi:Spy/CpxP family protein refolding chaperone